MRAYAYADQEMRLGARSGKSSKKWDISHEEYLELCIAILREAWRSYHGSSKDLQPYPGRGRGNGYVLRPAKEVAREWFLSDDSGCFTFVTICEVLGLEPGGVRRIVITGENRVGRQQRGGRVKKI